MAKEISAVTTGSTLKQHKRKEEEESQPQHPEEAQRKVTREEGQTLRQARLAGEAEEEWGQRWTVVLGRENFKASWAQREMDTI